MVLEKTLEGPLDYKEIQPVHPKVYQSWVFIGRTDVEAETPILWPPDAKSWLIGNDPDAGKDWGQEEKGTTEDEMVAWHHRLNGSGLGWTPGIGDGQGGLACYSSWGHKESDMTEQLNWTEHYIKSFPVILPTTDIQFKIFFPFCWVKENSILLLWFQLPCLLLKFEHLYRAIYISSFVNCPFLSLAHFSTWSFVFLLLICRDCSLYCLEFIEVYFVTHYLINLSLCCVSIWEKKVFPFQILSRFIKTILLILLLRLSVWSLKYLIC